VERLEGFHFRKLRSICGWSKADMKSRSDVYKSTGMENISTLISKSRIMWAAKVFNVDNYRVSKMVTCRMELMTKYERGAHSKNGGSSFKTWDKCLREDLREFGITGDKLFLEKYEIVSLVKEGTAISTQKQEERREKESVLRKRKSPEEEYQTKKKLVSVQIKQKVQSKGKGKVTSKGKGKIKEKESPPEKHIAKKTRFN
jgi:hypothetical protein